MSATQGAKGSKEVIVVIGAGQIGQAIARRVSVGKQVLLADRSEANAKAAAEAHAAVSAGPFTRRNERGAKA